MADAPPPAVIYSPMGTVYKKPANDDDHDSDEEVNWHEKTPLVSHSSRKGAPYRETARPQYSDIIERDEDDDTNTDTGTGDVARIDDDIDDDATVETSASYRSLSTVTTVMTNFKTSLMIPFIDEDGSLPHVCAGLTALGIVGSGLGLLMPKNQHLNEIWYRDISSMIGYAYFVYWSVCFYPQVLLNYRRKATAGLSKDFAILNFMGWSFYSAYIASMFFDHEIKDMYHERFGGHSTVQSNDVMFAVHAMTLSFIYLVQIAYYGDGPKVFLRLKFSTWVLVLGMGIPTIAGAILLWMGVLANEQWLNYFYMLSMFKLTCTFTKYSKQVLLNYKRKSTSGWNIWYNFLECTGGSLSLIQIVFDSLDMHDMTGITGNLAKFILGFATLFFDAIFFTQHYVLYPMKQVEDEASVQDIPKFIGDQFASANHLSLDDNSLNGSI
mmetsp:Transcript_5011/g.7600  ORF Transcript_5011/g.7600 Transcript_5011/m.7600 type:complete len:439 (+) Transcript_5011:204-1520(+)|eukprot:CAMPEP_0195302730 /NCGR_PEP_ID=MMETSP0707-20130614/31574_1 /TAXON_ID=33640 /ORGANISM="Asterionellopsis glacialis, Strain CCMP134" /LENGTH=438 /DNA_ID=CAMNT_0040366063 /DNA_START=157 /DNA_END=1473 /DNA_ORIENTATION=-